MFLSKLNEKEKILFCKLANYVACVDGIVKEELDCLSQYNFEMGINFEFEANCNVSVDEIIGELSDSSPETRNIIAFELIGLANADSNYSPNELKTVTEICFKLNVSPNKQKDMENLIEKIMNLYSEAVALLK